jgi:pimeloyl-ACP methyl ester carboxylesterase
MVPGTWHGGWCWQRLSPLLRAAGHEVYTPTLTGLGERVHLAHPDVGLTTHIEDVVAVLEYEDLHDVILVGHSYGGGVITGVGDRCRHRLAYLLYLDAPIPQDGECNLDRMSPALREATEAQVAREGDGWRIPITQEDKPFGVTRDEDARWVKSKITPQPFKTYTEPLRLSDPSLGGIPRGFIHCTQKPAGDRVAPFAQRARDAGLWFRELATGHDAMVTAPAELFALLMELPPLADGR